MDKPIEKRGIITESAQDFRASLPDGGANGGALLGIDLGTKTIGIATCDAGWRFATPGTTIPRAKFGRDVMKLDDIIATRQIRGIVMGLPRNMDGSAGARVQSSRAYAQNLKQALGLPILLWDERWSTLSAERAMIDQDTSRAKRAERIDSHAAAVILQGALDTLAGSTI